MTKRTPLERFTEKYRVDSETGCWVWTGAINGRGYGNFFASTGVWTEAHRVSYELFAGPIPDGLHIDHLCRNKRCCNPAHLEPVTQRENTLRGMSPIAEQVHRTHCPQGHPFDEANTYRAPGAPNQRKCRECRRRVCRESGARRRARRKAADADTSAPRPDGP